MLLLYPKISTVIEAEGSLSTLLHIHTYMHGANCKGHLPGTAFDYSHVTNLTVFSAVFFNIFLPKHCLQSVYMVDARDPVDQGDVQLYTSA